MHDFLGLCRELRTTYPSPAHPSLIKESILKNLGSEPLYSLRVDMAKALTAKWKRDGWVWDILGAIKLLPNEDACFLKEGIVLIVDDFHEDMIYLGENHPKVVWFR